MKAGAQTTVGSATISALGFGCVGIGGLYESVTEEQAEVALATAIAHGISYFDAAPVYGLGRAERRLGHFLHTCAEATVSTKVGRLLRPIGSGGDVDRVAPTFFAGSHDLEPVFDYSYDATMRSLEESLERLERTRVDILFIHDPDDHLEDALSGAYRALDRLRTEGVVGAIGVGATNSDTLTWLTRRARLDCLLVAGRYTLLDQAALCELLPLCAAADVSVIIGGTFNSGILANPWRQEMFDYVRADAAIVERARRMASVTASHDVPLAAAALQFAFGHPAVCAVLMGPRSAAEVEQNVANFERQIPGALWDELKRLRLLDGDVPVP